ncbi:MAG: hypothetical protein BRC44_06850 [Cyanobacteria bacterium QS_4_48_99]|nr:MAG: hypothetical protein BRC44_06850 [Cyanobacteria bacterium QS_4_48_99]
MIDLAPITDFSRIHCIAICGVLVPANLLASSQPLLLLFLRHSRKQLHLATGLAISLATIMILHVATWLMIGVVGAETFVLLGLGTSCLITNLWVIAYPQTFRRLLRVS